MNDNGTLNGNSAISVPPPSEARRLRREARAVEIIKTIKGEKWRGRRKKEAEPKYTHIYVDLPYEPESLVYFIYCAGRIKIGFTTDIESRMYNLATHCPFPAKLLMVIPGELADEKRFHERFATSRAHLEWFELSPELRAFLETNFDDGGREVLARAEASSFDIMLGCAAEAIDREILP